MYTKILLDGRYRLIKFSILIGKRQRWKVDIMKYWFFTGVNEKLTFEILV